ncbi:hydroxyisourate hydrolase [Marinibactrum halimedae]|uniref:5-hydroxyisourate hydrolase n=1 Tax=Marinibactrum halimedae TaxID=1444977 RepID=A0AA37WLL2_9GAMM|nr:hydroxyisourate hydrolase [Marinibactrum halimedae]MCD9459672.1 hydroxyisourate hydrolase [Marinibactrum halimedae]GLS25698.1 5-hydroxyisourate hydrolase [Marinibactrum halimedae]
MAQAPNASRAPITTHILDTEQGKPAGHVLVSLSVFEENQWKLVSTGRTNDDGRVEQWDTSFTAAIGLYQLRFETSDYFDRRGVKSFYPEVVISFHVATTQEHFHVPLLLSAHGYSTYRGS